MARKPTATPGAPTTRTDATFIKQVIDEAKRLADEAEREYAAVKVG